MLSQKNKLKTNKAFINCITSNYNTRLINKNNVNKEYRLTRSKTTRRSMLKPKKVKMPSNKNKTKMKKIGKKVS